MISQKSGIALGSQMFIWILLSCTLLRKAETELREMKYNIVKWFHFRHLAVIRKHHVTYGNATHAGESISKSDTRENAEQIIWIKG
jgi:hypothetical protein